MFPQDISTRICSIGIHYDGRSDRLIWPFDKFRLYPIKSGYKVLISKARPGVKEVGSSFSPHPKFWSLIWSIHSLPKACLLLWSRISEAIPVMFSLWHKNCAPTPMCPVCGVEPETIEKLLLLCPWVLEVWVHSTLKIHYNKKNISRFEE